MATDDYFSVDVVVPFADSLENLRALSIWLKKEEIPRNFTIILVHDVHKHDLASTKLLEVLNSLRPESYLYVKGTFGAPGTARNAGLRESTAQWVCFWDSDDYPCPHAFNLMIAAGIENKAQICVGNFDIVNFNSREKVMASRGNSSIQVAITPGFWRMAILKQSIGEVEFTNSRMGEDQLFLISIDFASLKWYRHNAVVYQYALGMSTQLTNSFSSYPDLLETLNNSIAASKEKNGFRANFIYSIMEARLALTILLRLPRRENNLVIRSYIRESFSSPKKIFFGTGPAYIIVILDLVIQAIFSLKNKLGFKGV